VTIVFSALSDRLIVMTTDSAVTRDFAHHREYDTEGKSYLFRRDQRFFDPYEGGKALEQHQHVTRMLHEAGGPIVGGTDCGALAYPPPGFALLREIELLAEAIGSLAALKAVTSVAARYLRKSEDVGSIAPGRYADLLVIDGDPLHDVRNLRKLTTVYRGGVAYDPQALLAQAPKSDFVPVS
jgi:imidazolonepropionase-like amidohydrolase